MRAGKYRKLATPLSAATVAAVIALAVPALATASSTGAVGRAAAAPAVTTSPSTARPAASTTVTLVTGDRVTLTPKPAGSGAGYAVRVQVAPRPDGPPATVAVTAEHRPGGDQVYGVPSDAQALVASGRLDRGLFDVGYLARHANPSGAFVVAVRFQRPMAEAGLRAAAGRLGGGSVVGVLDGQNAAAVRVKADSAALFWGSVTEGVRRGQVSASLARGIAAVWLDHHRLGSGHGFHVGPGDDAYTVTETVTAPPQSQPACGPDVYLCYAAGWQYLYGIEGTAVGQAIKPTDVSCDEPCRNLVFTFKVPAGTYSAQNLVGFKLGSRKQWAEADNPELDVSGDTALSFDLADAQQMTITAPQPTEAYFANLETFRSLPDGTSFASILFESYGHFNFWAVPTDAVQTGGYHLKSNWVLGQPLVSAEITVPDQVTLHPTYPGYRPGESTHFDGTTSAPVVAAGTGTRADFRGVDASGKLVLLYPPAGGCDLGKYQLKDALAAGAAGVIFDATNHSGVPGDDCTLPMLPYWEYYGGRHVPMPFVEIPGDEGTALRALLDQGEVDVTVTDNGSTPYEYDITLVQLNQVPDSLSYTFTAADLAHVDRRSDSATPALFDQSYTDWLPDETTVGGTEYDFRGPKTHQVYVGPVAPDVVYSNDMTKYDLSGVQLESMSRMTVYDKAGNLGRESWGDLPTEPGFPSPPFDVWKAQPGKWEPFAFCSACRQGDVFLPWSYLATPDPQQQDLAAFPGTNPASVRLYQGGVKLKQTHNDYGLSEYTLPPEEEAYRLTMTYAETRTTWHFTSSEPQEDESPRGYVCPGTLYLGLDGPCRAPSVIFLRYGAGVNLHDAVTAPGAHTLHVTAYDQAPNAPEVTALKVWTSTDSGATWVAATVQARGNGRFTAGYQVPELGGTTGTVSIRTTAHDVDGNSITQTALDAFELTGS